MELKLTFNTDPETYDRYRARYTEELFGDLIFYTGLNHEMKALEIGIGTGQATPYILQTACDLTAVEIGDELASFVTDKFSEYKNLQVINQSFEEVSLTDNSFDLIYSASAFHWIPLDEGMKKVKTLLKVDGVFAWIATAPLPAFNQEHIHQDIQKVYSRYSNYFGNNSDVKDLVLFSQKLEKKLSNRVDCFEQYGFKDVTAQMYQASRVFSSHDYIRMISTHSDHKIIPEKERKLFLEEIKAVIDAHGGKYELNDRFLLCMGRKG